jgi:hypothetical protein
MTSTRKIPALLVIWNKDLSLSIYPAAGGKLLSKVTMWHTDKSWKDAVAPFCEGWFGTDNRDDWRVRCTVA